MGFLRKLFGGGRDEYQPSTPQRGYGGQLGPSPDEQAVERYRYMLRTAPPDAIEQAHAEAFARLTPEQRRLALQQLGEALPEQERVDGDDPRSFARMATRAEMRQPGTLERTFGGVGSGGGMGMGGVLAGSLFASLAGGFIGTAIAQEFFDNDSGFESGQGGDGGGEHTDGGAETSGDQTFDAEGDAGGDFGGADFGGGGEF
ncbi:MAG: hypothetical protein H0V86_01575 [Chloroflexia bacterium]|nr:hypothetical protein [Chloroflexia bacterium]